VVAIIDPASNRMIGAIDSGSTNGHRLCISNDGKRLYTDNEEDATVSVIDLPDRKLLGKIATPQAIAGVGISGDGGTVIAVSDVEPVIFMIDAAAGKVTRTVGLDGAEKPAQIVRYSPDDRLIVVSNLNSNLLHIIDKASGAQSAIPIGSQPMDFAFRGDEIVVGCQGDGTMHVIDVPARRVKRSFNAGKGCESVGFF
jgi:DNA-binding beta-propeller fold protein YncE